MLANIRFFLDIINETTVFFSNIFLLVSDKSLNVHKSVFQSQYLCGLDFFFEIQAPFERELTAVLGNIVFLNASYYFSRHL